MLTATSLFYGMKRVLLLLAVVIGCAPRATVHPSARTTLDIYFIDVEGGQSTLLVTPAGESFLIDAGFPGDGTFASKPGDPSKARDAQRVLAATRDAGIARIDYLMLTHYHADHAGGVVELSQLLPIGTFIDHSAPPVEADAGVPGTMAVYEGYLARRASGRHIESKPGDRLPIRGVDAFVVSSGGATLTRPLNGAGGTNASCAGAGLPAQEKIENPRSTGVRVQFGNFSFLDVGDLSGAPLFTLICPNDMIGRADLYLVAHHAGLDAADPALFRTVQPRVAVFNNGPRKGGAAETFATLRGFPKIDVWQLHRSLAAGAVNVSDERVANLNEATSAWIKVSANSDGSFVVTNGRTGQTKSYRR
jgi:competence protein ComEC